MARPVKPPLPPHEHDAEYAAISHAHDWTEIADKPATFDPTPHVHPVADIDATGTADGTTYLRGDGTWDTPDGGAVDSVNAQTGAVVLDADDIDDTTAIHKYVTAADLTKLSNLSGTNTGDQDLSGYALTSSLAGVALSGAYTDLSGTPTIPNELTDLDTTVTGAQLNALKTKVDGIATGATANSSDATLLNRANHTGTQTASTISNFQSTVSANTDVAANTSARHTHANDAVLNATTASYTTTLNTKLSGIATGATANATDAQLRDRATHTGAQAISTVTGLQTALDAKASTSHTHGVSDLTATGTRDATTILYGDNTWKPAPSGGGGTGAVDSVNAQTGVVVLDADDIDDAATTNKFVTSGDITKLGNLSGTNTGDQDLSGYATTASVTAGLAGKADATHTHPQSDVTNLTTDLAGKASATTLTAALPSTVGTNGQVLKSNGTAVTWQTDANTTYSEIPSAEITAGTATTARAISGRRAQEIVTKARTGLAETASLATVATTGEYSDLSGAPAPLSLAGDGVATTAAKSDHEHLGATNSVQIGPGANTEAGPFGASTGSTAVGHGVFVTGGEDNVAIGRFAGAFSSHKCVAIGCGVTAQGQGMGDGPTDSIVIGRDASVRTDKTALLTVHTLHFEELDDPTPGTIRLRNASGVLVNITVDASNNVVATPV